MKKYLLTVTMTFCILSLTAQNTWFKFVPGWQAQKSIITNDTIVTFGTGDYSFYDFFAVFNRSKLDGTLLLSDTLNYKNIVNDINVSSSFWDAKIEPLKFDNKMVIPINVIEKTASKYDNRSYLFEYPSLAKLPFDLNLDTFTNYIISSKILNDMNYVILEVIIQYNKSTRVPSFYLFKLLKDSAILVKKQFNDASSIYGHIPYFENIHGDNQNGANLFLQTLDRWDFHGVPAQFEAVIQKIDTSGKLIWESRPSGNQDTINTTDFQMVQLPNGNILCSWLDFYYRPYKKPGDPYQFEEINDNATLWFAELDYQTGKRLWVKNNRQFLDWKMGITASDYAFNLMTDALIFNDGVVWCGYRYVDRPYPQSWTALPYLFKTDFKGNPKWYREYNLVANDTTDKGFKPYSFIRTPDKGFLLTGEYMRRWGVPSDTTQPMGVFQTAALLKLDSNGCFAPGCNATDNIIKIKAPQNICQVYPNPASNFINIEYPKGSYNWEITVIDLNGKEVFQSKETIQQIPTTTLPNGTYFIQLTNKKYYHHETHKIIIQH